MAAEQLRTAHEALRGKENELQARAEVSKAQQARAEGATLRLQQQASSTGDLHAQLAEAHERIAQLAEEIAACRDRERRATVEASAAKDEKALLLERRSKARSRSSPREGQLLAIGAPRLPAGLTNGRLSCARRERSWRRCRRSSLERQLREAGVAKAF